MTLVDVADSYLIVPQTVSPHGTGCTRLPGDLLASPTGSEDIALMTFPPRSEVACPWGEGTAGEVTMGGSLGKPGSGQSGRGQGPACEEDMGVPWSPSCHGSARGGRELALPVTPSLVTRLSLTPPTRGCAVGPQPWLVPLVSPACDLSGLPHRKLQGSQPVLGHSWEEPAGESAHWGPNGTKARAVLRVTHLPPAPSTPPEAPP